MTRSTDSAPGMLIDTAAADALMEPALSRVTLADKYTFDSGRVFLSGTQALVRLPLVQRRIDVRRGLNTAGFISGYRGSPLGNYDMALWQAKSLLLQHKVEFEPGLNEELAATAVWGSQQVGLSPGATVDGVFGIWYAKGPGVDRSMDVLKHANSAGVSPFGGVLAVIGDDHGAQSSTLLHQSEQLCEAAMIPVLHPSSVQELIDYGLYGFALSRFSGCWVALKATTEIVESYASIDASSAAECVVPDWPAPPGGLGIRFSDPPVAQEQRLHTSKMSAIAAFARANRIDRIVIDSPQARLGIVTTGKAHLDLMQALDDLGIDADEAGRLGLRLFKVGLSWPLEAQGVIEFARGLEQILVVEEKRAFLEPQLVCILARHSRAHPRVFGKLDEEGRALIPTHGELSPGLLAKAIASRLSDLGNAGFAKKIIAHADSGPVAPFEAVRRQAFFCSGCPHNTSTRLPEGSRAFAGTGCHFMASSIAARRTSSQTQMGGEGVNWIGQAPFTSEKHVFVNMGDGTYSHSGLLAIRAAASAEVNVTYKILYNDAVAMTGGQPADSRLTVEQIALELAAEGAKQIVIVAEDPTRHGGKSLPPNCSIRAREDLDQVQLELREIPGLTVVIYDQVCAAEKRRRRKRKTYPESPVRVFINDAVCEGCGDCSDKSNCISVVPLETQLGRKRRIDQSSCNMDTACIAGFCPSFVTVRGARSGSARVGGRQKIPASREIAEPPQAPLRGPYRILITGVGGTGVITIGALLGMAAHLEGRGCTGLDFTGLAQKNGPVTSHVQIAPAQTDLHAARIGLNQADLVLGCDMLVAAGPTALPCVSASTRAVINSSVQPVAASVANTNLDMQVAGMRQILDRALDCRVEYIDATQLATMLFGDSIFGNSLLLGFAFQRGWIPLRSDSLRRAIELNGAAVETNIEAFQAGRWYALDPNCPALPAEPRSSESSLAEILEDRADRLKQYQDRAYAQRYLDFMQKVSAVERVPRGSEPAFAVTVARNLFKLMAYKDEYEVARLHASSRFQTEIRAQFHGPTKLTYHLAPPLLARRNPVTGEPRKMAVGSWMLPVFEFLASIRRIRGSFIDVFAHTHERRMERKLIDEYRELILAMLPRLNADNYELAVRIASLPDTIRGYGHVKERNRLNAKRDEQLLTSRFFGGKE